jgi:hypothetical protein
MIDTKRIVNNKKNTPLDIISQYYLTSNLRLLRLDCALPYLVCLCCNIITDYCTMNPNHRIPRQKLIAPTEVVRQDRSKKYFSRVDKLLVN